MTPPTGIPLSIKLLINDNENRLILESSRGDKLEVIGELNLFALKAEIEYIKERLTEFKESIGKSSYCDDWIYISQAMGKLHQCGKSLLYELCGQQISEVIKVENFCKSAYRRWDRLGWDLDIGRTPGIVEFHTADRYGIPAEILPVFGYKFSPITDQQSFGNVARSFLGFASIVKWIIRGTHLVDGDVDRVPKLNNIPKLPIKFFHHKELEGSRVEADFFQANKDYIDIEGPWPEGNFTQDNFIEMFSKYMFDPSLRFTGSNRDIPDQILHLACHCDTSSSNPKNYELSLACKGKIFLKEYTVKLSDLQQRFSDLIYESENHQTSRPLVFLNACGSSNIDPAALGSFPKLFLNKEFNYLGFIGTHIPIPDKFAAKFAAEIYEYLIQGEPLGIALYRARWQMMRRYKNPLGILYCIYADPNIIVRKPKSTFL